MHESFFQFHERPLVDGGAGDQQKIALRGETVLMSAKKFAETAFGAIAMDGVADGGGGGDHAGAGSDDGDFRRAREPPDREGARVETTAFSPDSTNFVLAAEVLLRAKTHGPRRDQARAKPRGIRRRSDACDL